MSIQGLRKYSREFADVKIVAAKKLCITIVVAFAILALLVVGYNHFLYAVDIFYKVELTQALLLCSTALMGLSGVIIVETKKADVMSGLSSNDMFEQVHTVNKIAFLAEAGVYIRWTIALSIVSILFSFLFLILNNIDFTIISIAAFAAQIYLFIWGLTSWDLFT